jgi:uncharacterized protein (DUF2141 family)
MKKLFTVFMVVFLLFLVSCDGGNGNIQGEIKLNLIEHIEGKDLGGTTVKIKGRNETAATDKDGKFTLKNIEAGTYTLTISRDDWDTKEVDVNITGGDIAELDETLDYSFGIVKGYIEFPDYKGEEATVRIKSEAEGKEEITVQAIDIFSFTKLNAGNYKVTVDYGSVNAFFKKTIINNTLYEEHMKNLKAYLDSDGDGLLDSEDFAIPSETVFTTQLNALIKNEAVEVVLPPTVGFATATIENGDFYIDDKVATGPYKLKNGDMISIGMTTPGENFIKSETKVSITYGEGYTVEADFSIWTGSNYTIISDDIVLDNDTGLMWQRGSNEEFNIFHDQAVEYCDNLILGEYDDWRLPTISELRTIVRGCSKVETGEQQCVLPEGCTSSCSCLWLGNTPNNESYYWQPGVWKNIGAATIWSASILSNSAEYWTMKFRDACVMSYPGTVSSSSGMQARCIRP